MASSSPPGEGGEVLVSRHKLHHRPKYIKLNVGGHLHYTTLDTLTKHKGNNMLSAMFSGRMELVYDNEGWVTIDRDGRMFTWVLNYLRDSKVSLPTTRDDKLALLAEARYYVLDNLVAQIEHDLANEVQYRPVCAIPVITSENEELELIASSRNGPPLVKFVYNRSNNKFSYTAPSDDALLKNIELFDKISQKFQGRVRYAKDIGSRSGHICTWFFYGHGRLVGEVCCTSMVYSAEKKHTKIEFPEARLYEENMNILLYEESTHMRQTSVSDVEEDSQKGDYLARRNSSICTSPIL